MDCQRHGPQKPCRKRPRGTHDTGATICAHARFSDSVPGRDSTIFKAGVDAAGGCHGVNQVVLEVVISRAFWPHSASCFDGLRVFHRRHFARDPLRKFFGRGCCNLPGCRSVAEIAPEAKGHVRGDFPLTADDVADARIRHSEVLCETACYPRSPRICRSSRRWFTYRPVTSDSTHPSVLPRDRSEASPFPHPVAT